MDAYETYDLRKKVLKYFRSEIRGETTPVIPQNNNFWAMMAKVDSGMDHAALYPEAEALTRDIGPKEAMMILEGWVRQAQEAWEAELLAEDGI